MEEFVKDILLVIFAFGSGFLTAVWVITSYDKKRNK